MSDKEKKNKKELVKQNKRQITEEQEIALLNSFSQTQNQNETVEILKELFDKEKLLMITDLEPNEIPLIVATKTCADLKSLSHWDNGIEMLSLLKISQKRKSRREIIDAIKGQIEKVKGLRRLFQSERGF